MDSVLIAPLTAVIADKKVANILEAMYVTLTVIY